MNKGSIVERFWSDYHLLYFYSVMCFVGNSCTRAVLCRLCDEFEEISEKALTTPANTKELMELKAFVENVEMETMYALERKLIHAKSTLVFLIEYTNLSPAEMRANADMFAWYERMPCIFEEHRAIIAAKRTQYEEALKVCLLIMKTLLMWFVQNKQMFRCQ